MLNSTAQAKLEQMSLDLKHLKQVLITSYVPSVGDVTLNQQFANERVNVVKNFLIQQGVPADVISTQAIPGARQRVVELSYGAASSMAAATPPPPPPTSQPAAFAPPPPPPAPASEPVITAQPEKKYDSGVTEANVAEQPYTGEKGTPPSRWEY